MATIRRASESDEELADRFLDELDDNLLYCRARRRHRYPVILPPARGKTIKLPKGFTFEFLPHQPGMVQVTETCEICGRSVTRVTTRDAFLTTTISRKYEDPAGYAAPKGTGDYLRGNVAAQELERRLGEGGLFGMPDDA